MKDCRCDIYDPKDEKENKIYRYALGKNGKNMIICIGLNPSSATDKEPDRTFNKIYPQAPIWCAWGRNIRQKKFKDHFNKISHLIENRKCACTSETTKGHPRHPLYVAGDTPLKEFCIKNYIQQNIIDF